MTNPKANECGNIKLLKDLGRGGVTGIDGRGVENLGVPTFPQRKLSIIFSEMRNDLASDKSPT